MICPLCGSPISIDLQRFGICSTCLDRLYSLRIRKVFSSVCTTCGMPVVVTSCTFCNSTVHPTIRCDSVFFYRGLPQEVIRLYKFEGMKQLSHLFSSLIQEELSSISSTYPNIVVPIPGNPNNVKRRGWDQVKAICDILRTKQICVYDLLKRRYDSHGEQKSLSKKERHTNVTGMFAIDDSIHQTLMREHVSISSLEVVIVDDIRTTGATLDAAAAELRERGYVNIRAITLGLD